MQQMLIYASVELNNHRDIIDSAWEGLSPDDGRPTPTMNDIANDFGRAYMNEARQESQELFSKMLAVVTPGEDDDIEEGSGLLADHIFAELMADQQFTYIGHWLDFTTFHWAENRLALVNMGCMAHPAAPLIEAWRRLTDIDRRETGIMPQSVLPLGTIKEPPPNLAHLWKLDTQPALGYESETLAYLTGFAPAPRSALVPALPLYMYDSAGGKSLKQGRGAPLSLRLWVEMMLAVPQQRRVFGANTLTLTLRELRDWLWPNGWPSRRDALPRLQLAMFQADQLRIEIPYGKGRTLYRAVSFRGLLPNDAGLDDVIIVDVHPPESSSSGALVHKPSLRALGVKSALEYRAELGLAYLWDKYGSRKGTFEQHMRPVVKRDPRGFMIDSDGKALLERNGKPSALNNHPRAVPILDNSGNLQYERNPRADCYPVLSNDDIVRLCFPDDLPSSASKSAHRQRLYNARQALQGMQEAGYCIIEEDQYTQDGLEGWRILPPAGWGVHYSYERATFEALVGVSG